MYSLEGVGEEGSKPVGSTTVQHHKNLNASAPAQPDQLRQLPFFAVLLAFSLRLSEVSDV